MTDQLQQHQDLTGPNSAGQELAVPKTYAQTVWVQFRRNKMAVGVLVIMIVLYFLAVAAPLLVPYSPEVIDLGATLSPPSAEHPLGTDKYGRDVLSRVVYGSRVSLAVGFVAVGISVTIGTLLGALAGYYGGVVDNVIMRLVDVVISFPLLFLILTVMAFVGPSIWNIMIVIGVFSWTGVARLVRGQILSLREQEFVEAARAMGASDYRIIFRTILPNAVAPVIVAATLGVAGAILTESALSYLGLGVQPPIPSWGNMLFEGQSTFRHAWWIATFPGAAIFITVMCFNILGDALRDALDPKLRR